MTSTEIANVIQYNDFREKINEVKETCHFLPDVTTDEGYAKSKRVSLDVGKLLTALETCRKDLKADSLAFGRKIDSEAKLIADELQSLQEPHKIAYKELDGRKKEREKLRKEKLEERVSAIRNLPDLMADSDSNGIKLALDDLSSNECLDYFEYTEQALKARNASKSALTKMFSVKLQQEKEAIELAELRKKQAEQEQKDHDEAVRKAARVEAEKETQRVEKEKQNAIKAAEIAEHQRLEAIKQAALQAELAEKARIVAEELSKQDAINAAELARQQQINTQKAKEAAELAEQQRKEANKRHVGAIRRSAKEDIMLLGFTEEQAKKLVLAISNKEISNISINY